MEKDYQIKAGLWWLKEKKTETKKIIFNEFKRWGVMAMDWILSGLE